MQRGRALPACHAAVLAQLLEPPAQIDLVDVRARARELRHVPPALHVVSCPLLAHAAVPADDVLRIGLAAIDREQSRGREMLADTHETGPAIVRREHEEGVERYRDEGER